MTPYEIEVWVDGERQDVHHIEDPFHTTTVVTGWSRKDWFKMFFRHKREVVTTVSLRAHTCDAINRVMNALHPDCAGCGTGEDEVHGDHAPRATKPMTIGGTSG